MTDLQYVDFLGVNRSSAGSSRDNHSHRGQKSDWGTRTVCGKVASVRTATSSEGESTFINLDFAYPNQVFTILVWGDDRKSVGELPRAGDHVCATGSIQDYRGVPEIVVEDKSQLSR